MSVPRNPKEESTQSQKIPRRHWNATEPFWDFRASHWIEVVLTVALVFVGLAQFTVYMRQAQIMTTQTQISKRQLAEMQLEQRPWISIDPAIGAVTWDKDGLTVDLRYTLENTGHSPAMHANIHDEIVPVLEPPGPLAALKKMTVPFEYYGLPLFPQKPREVYSIKTFSREQTTKLFQYLRTFKHSASDPDQPLSAVNKIIALTIVYRLDYTSGTDWGDYHQSCMGDIVQLDPKKLIDLGLDIPVDVNLVAPYVGIRVANFGCSAD